MKYKLIIILIIVSLSTYANSLPIKTNSYHQNKINPQKDELPETIEDCFKILNNSLDKKTIDIFKNEDITIAVINIARTKDSYYIDNWNLNFRLKSKSNYSDNIPKLLAFFEDKGIYNPKLIIRSIFSFYHYYLNNNEYDVDDETLKIINIYKTSQKNKRRKNYHYYYYTQWENSIIRSYNYKKIKPGNIIGALYKEKHRGSDFYLSGIKLEKKGSLKEEMIKIFDIVSEKRYNTVLINNDTISVGDTISYSNLIWHKYVRKDSKFYYKEYKAPLSDWQKYIYKKYPEMTNPPIKGKNN